MVVQAWATGTPLAGGNQMRSSSIRVEPSPPRAGRVAQKAILVIGCLAAEAVAQPAALQEFFRGEKETFSTQGHPKAKGVNLRISYPRSWAAMEGERPNIVQKFVSEDGRGLEMAMIITRAIPAAEAAEISREAHGDFFAPSSLMDLVPEGAALISAERTEIEGLPAGSVEYSMEVERAGMKLFTRTWMLIFLSGDTLVSAMFSISDTATNKDGVPTRMESIRPLFFQMANSIVLPDLWTSRQGSTSISPTSPVIFPKAVGSEDEALRAVERGLGSYFYFLGLLLIGASVLRYGLIRRALSRRWAFAVCAIAWFVLVAALAGSGVKRIPSWVHAGTVIAFFILTSRRGANRPGDVPIANPVSRREATGIGQSDRAEGHQDESFSP